VTNALVATRVTKRYGKTTALEDCSLAIPEGRIAALVGPNGAGKTTLLHLAVGLLRPTSGEMRVLGRLPGDDVSQVGFVAQDAPLYRDFTARELITMCTKLNATYDDDLAVSRLEEVGVPLDRSVASLSGGQHAQVALSLALGKRPRLLLLDEPLASLDPLARRDFLGSLMSAVTDHSLSVILSSHLIADMERVCDHLILLHAGRVQVLGDIDDLLDSHKVLVGPAPKELYISGVQTIVQASMKGRQGKFLVRTHGQIRDSAWDVHDVSLEDIILAYLSDPAAGHFGGPEFDREGIDA
jgi:ABC-2 type transport system ATP-binding protein